MAKKTLANKKNNAEKSPKPRGGQKGNQNAAGFGRPPKFSWDLARAIIEKMAEGMSLQGAAAELDITRQIVYLWEKEDKEFAALLSLARSKRVAFLERSLISEDSGPRGRSLMFLLKNAEPEYRDKFDIEHSGGIAGEMKMVFFGSGDIAAVTEALDKADDGDG